MNKKQLTRRLLTSFLIGLVATSIALFLQKFNQQEFVINYFIEECVDGDESFRKKCNCVFNNFGMVTTDFDEVINYCEEKQNEV